MFKINIKSEFAAAHRLHGYNGPCKDLHGHNFKVRACLHCEDTDEIGLSVDFKILKQALNSLIDQLDHKDLNQVEGFDKINPTSENLARWIFNRLSHQLDTERLRVAEVEVWESDTASVIYCP